MGLQVYDLYVEFDNPDDNLLLMGTDLTYIWTDDPEGFYQHPFGTNTAPSQVIIDFFPELAYDSFVTIGMLLNDGTDATTLAADFDIQAFNFDGEILGSWYNSSPPNGQGNPDVNGMVPIAQVTVTQGYEVWGDVWIFYNTGLDVRRYFATGCSPPPTADFNGDGWVTSSDLAHVLSNWGRCTGCDADLDGDGQVGASALAQLLGQWGPCG